MRTLAIAFIADSIDQPMFIYIAWIFSLAADKVARRKAI